MKFSATLTGKRQFQVNFTVRVEPGISRFRVTAAEIPSYLRKKMEHKIVKNGLNFYVSNLEIFF